MEAGDPPGLAQKLAMFRAVHTLVLEPSQWELEYAIYSGRRDKRTKAYQAFLSLNEGKTVLTPDEYSQAMDISAAVLAHPWVVELLEDGDTYTEGPMFWEDIDAGECKGKADILHSSPSRGIILADLKTFATTDGRAIARQGGLSGWHLQAAHYLAGAQAMFGDLPASAFLIGVEAKAPHDVTVAQWSPDTLRAAEAERRGLLMRLRECVSAERWPGRPRMQTIEVPPYLL